MVILALFIQLFSFIAAASYGERMEAWVCTKTNLHQKIAFIDYCDNSLRAACEQEFGKGELHQNVNRQNEYYYFFALPSTDDLTRMKDSVQQKSLKIIFQEAIDTLNALNELRQNKSTIVEEEYKGKFMEKMRSFMIEMKDCKDTILIKMLDSLELQLELEKLF